MSALVAGSCERSGHGGWFLTFCLLVALALAGCSERRDQSENIPSLSFNVVDSLISKPVGLPDEGIVYSFPVEWKEIPDSILANMEGVGVSGPVVRVKAAYVDPSKTCYLIVARLDSVEQQQFKEFTKTYAQEFARKYVDADTHTTVFAKEEFIVHQMLGVAQASVHLRLIFSSPVLRSPLEFDFVLPRSRYSEKIKQIESVIGSIALESTHNSPLTNK